MNLLETLRTAHAEAAPAVKPKRFFVRCTGCLATAAVDVPPAEVKTFKARFGWGWDGFRGVSVPIGPECGGCGAVVELVGPVVGDNWTRIEHRTPCDDRCTNAPGPKCECKCGGENHGTRLLVPVVAEEGRAKVTPVAAEKARARRWEFEAARHAAREAIEARFGRLFAAKRAGEWLSGADFSDLCEGIRLVERLGAARKRRSHAGRMKVVKEVAADAVAP